MTITNAQRGLAALAGCVAVIALIAACGGGNAAPGSGTFAERLGVDVARDAPDLTRAAGTSRYAFEMTDTDSGGPLGDSSFTTSGTGTYDYVSQIGDGELTSTGDGLGLPPQEVVFRNNVLYQRDVGASRWQKIDYSELVNTPIGQHDPSQQLDLLRGVSDDVREVGTTQVRGADVRQYAITIDPQRLAAANSVVVEGGLTQAALRAAGPIPGQVFVDADGRVRRLEIRMETNGADLAESPEVGEMLGDDTGVQEMLRERRTVLDLSIDYFDFGVPVTAQEPDQSMVVDTGLPFPIPGNVPFPAPGN
jgi:hypothetical protein